MFRILKFLILLIICSATFADEPLPPDEAFQFQFQNTDKLRLSWQIADGYYLYQHKFRFTSLTKEVELGEAIFPDAEMKQDENFGEVKIYHHHLEIEVPIKSSNTSAITLDVTFQGCAEAGICYLPIKKTVTFSRK